jgi:hypothetical protein
LSITTLKENNAQIFKQINKEAINDPYIVQKYDSYADLIVNRMVNTKTVFIKKILTIDLRQIICRNK